ncbi:MAG: hypothetical protein WC788_04215 [Candidatus Paceibacterota bacterium]|jgi:hypothetical protein
MTKFISNKTALHDKGAIALPTVLILAAALLAIGLAMNLASYNKIEIIRNNENALNAYYIAEAGIRDALEKVARDKNYNTGYTLQLNNGTATIDFDSSPPPNQIIITSTGLFDNNTKKIQASFDMDSNGRLTLLSKKEIF